jgi:hypothetical protein
VSSTSRKYWRWAAVVACFLILAAIVSGRARDLYGRISPFISVLHQSEMDRPLKEKPSEAQKLKDVAKDQEMASPADEETKRGTIGQMSPVPKAENLPPDAIIATKSPQASETPLPKGPDAGWKTVIVKEGETLAGLAASVYGFTNQEILDLLKKNNPELRDVNLINVGQKIVFPRLPPSGNHFTYTVHIASFKPLDAARNLFEKLVRENYDAYILPFNDGDKGMVFRVTVGNFQHHGEAQKFAHVLLEKGVSDYARPIQLEMR